MPFSATDPIGPEDVSRQGDGDYSAVPSDRETLSGSDVSVRLEPGRGMN
jgi:hypothetical protein